MSCLKVRSHIVDSRFFSKGYTTDEARRIFCDYRRFQRWLDVEVALAQSQAHLGIIPRASADELAKTARIGLLDLEAVKSDIASTGHSLIPLLNAWQKVSSPEAGRYIHHGATTQDIQDSAQSLELKDVLSIFSRDVRLIIQELMRLAEKYRDLVMIGRTHGQHALPMTFGLKIAVWLDELLRNADRLNDCCLRLPVSQLFGGVGTMDAFGEQGLALLADFSKRLGLAESLSAWHTSRDRLAEYQSFMAILAGNLAKIANEICQLARDEIGELEEPFHLGKIGSSTMPHKRNPEMCEQVVVLAKLIRVNAGLGFESLVNEHERDYRAIRLEWVALTEASLFMCGALDLMKSILGNLIVHHETIRTNTEKSASLISTEALMFALGEKIGKQKAHTLLYEASMEARSTGRHLLDLVMDIPEIQGEFSREELDGISAPSQNVGLAAKLTDRVLEEAAKWLASGSQPGKIFDKCPLSGKKDECC